jgi:hypothetical protein
MHELGALLGIYFYKKYKEMRIAWEEIKACKSASVLMLYHF